MPRNRTDSVNLLSGKVLARLEKRQVIGKWLRVALFVAILSIFTIVAGQKTRFRQQQEISQLNTQVEEPQRLLEENRKLRSQLDAGKLQAEKERSLTTKHSPLVVLSLLSKLKSELDEELQLEKFSQRYASSSEEKSAGEVTLTMTTTAASKSAQIVEVLKASRFFLSVELMGSLEKLPGQNSGLRFSLRCIY